MADVNPELAELVTEVLEKLRVPESVTFTEDGDHLHPVDQRIDAYGAAFRRLYALVASDAESRPQRRSGRKQAE